MVKKIKIHCERCCYLYKRKIDVEMGPVSSYHVAIVPVFYETPVLYVVYICGLYVWSTKSVFST